MAFSTTTSNPPPHESYSPPQWTQGYFTNVPTAGRFRLAQGLPTPLQHVRIPEANDQQHSLLQLLATTFAHVSIKRDDLTGSAVETGGNKIRKLEFLLAEAVIEQQCNAVVTIGGAQSNHCRATAAACRMVGGGGVEPHLILRTRENVGLVGNVLFDRLLGSTIYTCTPGEYGRLGSTAIVERVCEHLKTTQTSSSTNGGKPIRPYAIPVGGSNGLGTWGYIDAVEELMQQLDDSRAIDHIVVACGSGGTAAGVCLGMALYHRFHHGKKAPTIHAMGVCDSPDYFYDHVASIADEMGLQVPKDEYTATEDFIRQHLVVHSSKGRGYALSTPPELQFIAAFARATGIVLDPVYTGKALYSFLHDVVQADPTSFRDSHVLFWHTGGALGLYDKCADLVENDIDGTLLQSPCHRLDIYGKGGDSNGGYSRIDISKDVNNRS